MSQTNHSRLGALVMAAGLGTRMRSATPKHLHSLLGRRMVDWVLHAARELEADPLVVVASPSTADAFGDVAVAVQESPLGTGDAVRSAQSALAGVEHVLVLSGDTPLLTSALLRELLDTHRREEAAATVLSFEPDDLREYGRVVRNGSGALAAIVEAADASPEELAVREVNSSIYVFRARAPVARPRTSDAEECPRRALSDRYRLAPRCRGRAGRGAQGRKCDGDRRGQHPCGVR